ncbi:ribonuclease III [Candidatus Gracilibacteria bacterium]|nr:ribonuclease III [Candidatus Gracilibacteria bacterium]
MTDFSPLEKLLNLKFKNHELFERAFTHRSFLNENKGKDLKSNERLEFLGDAVLELSATHHLFHKYPDQDEGQMTSFRSALVKGEHLAQVARELELGQYFKLSNGEERSKGRQKSYLLANSVESLIGAIYVDQGYEIADQFVQKFVLTKLDQIIAEGLHIDAKSHFQELAQEKLGHTPHYELISDHGPDHSKLFIMAAHVGDELIAEGQGPSKQKAEDDAARNALKKLKW